MRCTLCCRFLEKVAIILELHKMFVEKLLFKYFSK